MKKVIIYVLYDPRNGHIRYVGKCTNLKQRLKSHINEKRTNRKCRWIASLKENGLLPCVAILEYIDEDGWEQEERRWISYFRWSGVDLCNHTDGGDGIHNPDKETREKISKSRLKDWSENREVMLSRVQNPERRRKISEALTGKPKTSEHIAKLLQNKHGRTIREEVKAKISLALLGNSYVKGTKRTTEFRLEQSIRQTGKKFPNRKPWSDAEKLKRSIATKGRPKSEEWKHKASLAATERWKRERERERENRHVKICSNNV